MPPPPAPPDDGSGAARPPAADVDPFAEAAPTQELAELVPEPGSATGQGPEEPDPDRCEDVDRSPPGPATGAVPTAPAGPSADAEDFAKQTTGPYATAHLDEGGAAATAHRPPPVPAAAVDPALDAGEEPPELVAEVPAQRPPEGAWQAERRSVHEPKEDPLSISSVNAALSVIDVDARPLDRRATGLSSPWQASTTPSATVEAVSAESEVALSALPELRRGTQPVEALAPRRLSAWLLVALIGTLAAAVAAAFLVWRAQVTPAPVVTPMPPPPPEVAPKPTAEEVEVARKKLRAAVIAANRREAYAEVITLGAELEATYGLDWEAEWVIAEAHRLARRCPDAVVRYAGFVERFPSNTRTDDAHFWMAECLRQQGDKKGARWHYKAVLSTPSSNLARSAKKRLRELD
jgi:hypothetical protein